MAGMPGLEPETEEPESPVLPITPHPSVFYLLLSLSIYFNAFFFLLYKLTKVPKNSLVCEIHYYYWIPDIPLRGIPG